MSGRGRGSRRRSEAEEAEEEKEEDVLLEEPNPPVAPVVFSLTPGQATQGLLDYNTKAGRSHYGHATSKLEEELYDCSPEGFYQFMKSLGTRAEEYGWSNQDNGVLRLPLTNDPRSEELNLLEDFGRFSLERVQEYENGLINQQTRRAQEDRMLYECILNSLTVNGKAKLNVFHKDYHVGNPALPSGLCLLKVLVRESHLDSNATSAMIRMKLSNLDSYIHTVGNDIDKFNNYVKIMVDTLAARGEVTNDLLTNLFKGYQACSDKNFVAYIGLKLNEYEEGKPMTAQSLMNLATQKFKTLKTKEIWEAPSPEEEKLMALEARFAELKKKFAEKRKGGSLGSNEGPMKKKQKLEKKDNKKNAKEKPKWMYERPSDAELKKPKKWNGNDWWYCSAETGGKCDGVYRIHKPHQCKGTAKSKKGGKPTDGDKKERRVVINEALNEIQGGYIEE